MTPSRDLGDRYADAMGYALRLANKRAYDRFRIHDALLRDDLLVEVQQLHGASHASEMAYRLADRALAQAELKPPELARYEVPARIERYRRGADARRWVGRTGPTDRRVLEAAYLTGFICRSMKFGLSVRTWGLRAGLHRAEISRSAKRLERAGLIVRTHRGTPNVAARFHLQRPKLRQWGLPPLGGPIVSLRDLVLVGVNLLDQGGFERVLLAHDAFRPAALGSQGWMVSRLLTHENRATVADIAARSGIPVRATCLTLDALKTHGAVIETGGGFVRVIESLFIDGLDMVAADAGTLGDLERDRDRYAEERRVRDDESPNALVVSLEAPIEAAAS
jgi:hypothetical protein